MTTANSPTDEHGVSKVFKRKLVRLAKVDVKELKGVGPKKQQDLAKLGIFNILDLITFYPRKWIDRDKPRRITDLKDGEDSLVAGEVKRVNLRRIGNKRSLLQVAVRDSTGYITLTFFNQSWMQKKLPVGIQIEAFGKVSLYRGYWQMSNPVVDILGEHSRRYKSTGKVVSLYRVGTKTGLTSNDIALFMQEALDRAGEFVDPLPLGMLSKLHLLSRTEATRSIHFPPSIEKKNQARDRLAFDELLRLQIKLLETKRLVAGSVKKNKYAIVSSPLLAEKFIANLPFPLTGDQEKAIKEIYQDLVSDFPMHRLLQGDVGSGKTIVALATLLYGVEYGYQGAMMVPTEVLAEQHFISACNLLTGLDVVSDDTLFPSRNLSVALLTSSTTTSERNKILEDLIAGRIDILIGTHALLTEDVVFKSLQVVVIDEQHRFGVDQRETLKAKGKDQNLDVLVMTATPIPRTVAMTVYGDLDQTVISQLPKGRAPIETVLLEGEEGEAAAYQKALEEIKLGHQIYIVCPLVADPDKDLSLDDLLEVDEDNNVLIAKGHDSYIRGAEDEADDPYGLFDAAALAEEGLLGSGFGKSKLHSVLELKEKLIDGLFQDIPVGFLHGRMTSSEKEAQMTAFRRKETMVMVATTVIEVGVDVPTASVMVILNADRFGMAQLHQLRGRVGRGDIASFCYLIAGSNITDDAKERLEAVAATTDGFRLAEADLYIRGEGMILGVRQTGSNGLKLASLRRDYQLIKSAREAAAELLDKEEFVGSLSLLKEEIELMIPDEQAEYLTRN